MWKVILTELAKTALVNVILPVLTKYAQEFETKAEDLLKTLKEQKKEG